MKTLLAKPPLLALFDPQKPTKISSDASPTGLGAVLLQHSQNNWRNMAYVSRVLTDVESRYSQIEKEALGIVMGCEKFHQFVYGMHITIETDHQPLISICKKSIADMPPRLQRFFIRLLKYDFTMQFVPGKNLLVADMLSRAPVNDGSQESTADVEIHATGVLWDLVSAATLTRLTAETAKDLVLQQESTQLPLAHPSKGSSSLLSRT